MILEAIPVESGEMSGAIPYALGKLRRLVRLAIASFTRPSDVMVEMARLAFAPRTIS